MADRTNPIPPLWLYVAVALGAAGFLFTLVWGLLHREWGAFAMLTAMAVIALTVRWWIRRRRRQAAARRAASRHTPGAA